MGDGSCKSQTAKVLDSKKCECLLLLVLVDIALLSVEAGIDHHLICVNGEVIPRPVGLPPPHHFFMEMTDGQPPPHQIFLQITDGYVGWPTTPMSSIASPAFHLSS